NLSFNVYRKDGASLDFIQLNKEPVTGIAYPHELAALLGDDYEKLSIILDTDSPAAMYYKLKSSGVTGRLLTFIYPKVAQAMGNLFVDKEAPISTTVTYRIAFMDDNGEPTGEVLEKEVTLRPH